MTTSKGIILITILTSSPLINAQTFNNVEKSKKYKLQVTSIPTEFEDEAIDPEESNFYNEGYNSEVLDEYDIPEVVDTGRESSKETNNKQALQKETSKTQALKED